MSRRKQGNRGFTLVEVIVVLVILAILAAIFVPSLSGWIDKAKEKAAHTDMHDVAVAARSAYAEVYAEFSNINDETQVLYVSKMTSTEEHDKVFAAALKSYIDDDTLWENTLSVLIMGDNMDIAYKKDGVRYGYHSSEGEVTITKY